MRTRAAEGHRAREAPPACLRRPDPRRARRPDHRPPARSAAAAPAASPPWSRPTRRAASGPGSTTNGAPAAGASPSTWSSGRTSATFHGGPGCRPPHPPRHQDRCRQHRARGAAELAGGHRLGPAGGGLGQEPGRPAVARRRGDRRSGLAAVFNLIDRRPARGLALAHGIWSTPSRTRRWITPAAGEPRGSPCAARRIPVGSAPSG